jgi:hypothetical protein
MEYRYPPIGELDQQIYLWIIMVQEGMIFLPDLFLLKISLQEYLYNQILKNVIYDMRKKTEVSL